VLIGSLAVPAAAKSLINLVIELVVPGTLLSAF